MIDVGQTVQAHKTLIVKTRRDLHRIPETAFTEEKTASYIQDFLHTHARGFSLQSGIAGFGVLATLDTGKPGKTVLIRSDMDALPIEEKTGLPFSSTHPSLMHACGHDGHMSMVLVSAVVLEKLSHVMNGTVKFLFQPAEEGPGGALPMIEEGVMQNPTVDYSLGCHLWPGIPEGSIGVREGVLMSSVGRFDLVILGEGGHGALPHHCVDALEVGTQVVNALQRITSRHIDPLEAAVVTVGTFHAGNAFNVIPGSAEMSGTLRTFNRETWNSWKKRLERIVRGVCDSMGASYELSYKQGYPPLQNSRTVVDVVRECATRMVGTERVCVPEPSMVAEDMAYYLERSEGCYFLLGIGRGGHPQLHNPHFNFNEEVLPLGVELFCRSTLHLLGAA